MGFPVHEVALRRPEQAHPSDEPLGDAEILTIYDIFAQKTRAADAYDWYWNRESSIKLQGFEVP